MNYRALMRRKLLESIYDKMSDEEKRLYVQMTKQDRDHREIMEALQQIDRKADDNHHSWLSDLSANISGNIITDGAAWVLSRLVKKL